MRKVIVAAALLTVLGVPHPTEAGEFSFTFDWGKIPSCSDGNTFEVTNPIFKFSNVPTGTKTITLYMEDTSVGYDHEGGSVKYTGDSVIQRGVFNYLVPCPPNGTHTYEWTAYAKSASDDTLGTASSAQDYP